MFPIVDVRGNVIGFGGRVLGDTGEPEIPEFARDAGVREGPRALRPVPGAARDPRRRPRGRGRRLHGRRRARAAGIDYAVATLGTATTPVHVQKLLRQADEIVFCFDGDAAGRRAAWRALENSLAQLQDGKQVRFLFLPEGEDPDTLRAQARQGGVRAAAGRRAMPLSRFLLEELAQRVDLATAEGRASCVHAAKPLLKQMQANALRLQLVRELAEQVPPDARGSRAAVRAAASAAPGRAAAPARVQRDAVDRHWWSKLCGCCSIAARNSRDRCRPEQRRCSTKPSSPREVVDRPERRRGEQSTTGARCSRLPGTARMPHIYEEIAGARRCPSATEGV